MSIRILPDEVASQIAAGEVVERPASAVKELLENSLDAGAGAIRIEVEAAGRRKISISDDGSGIPPSELQLAVSRHATSKLVTAQDLLRIATLGFRGEALASIGSVSRLSITSKNREEAVGAHLVVEAGKITGFEQAGAPDGTVVLVEDLFYNVPARLNFLKQDVTERRQIDALVTRYAIAYPNVRFQLIHDGAVTLRTTGNGDRREVLANLYGVDTAKQMLEIMLEDEDFAVSGFVSPISLTRSNRREMTFFVNGRWVQDQALSSALLQAYHTFLMVGRYPLAVLFIQMDPEDVDVNVHPAKAEVRFREPSRVFAGVQRAVRRGLLAHSPVPQLNEVRWQAELPSYPAQNYQNDRGAGLDWDMAASFSAGTATDAPDDTGIPGQPAADTGQQAVFSGSLPLLRLVGQVGGTYLVAEGPDGLYLIDQHAAHERVLFERMMGGKTANRPIAAQALLEPVTVQLPPESSHILTEQISVLNRFGFEVEAFGPNMFQVRAVPAILTHIDPANALKVIVEDFEEDETPLKDEIDARLIARICKRSAVKGGRILSQEEQAALLRDLEACQSPRTCPHGRPTMIHLSVNLLERQFGRLGSR